MTWRDVNSCYCDWSVQWRGWGGCWLWDVKMVQRRCRIMRNIKCTCPWPIVTTYVVCDKRWYSYKSGVSSGKMGVWGVVMWNMLRRGFLAAEFPFWWCDVSKVERWMLQDAGDLMLFWAVTSFAYEILRFLSADFSLWFLYVIWKSWFVTWCV